MSELSDRCQRTLDYRSKAFVDDAITYARWILCLKESTPAQRAGMLRELDGVNSATTGSVSDPARPAG